MKDILKKTHFFQNELSKSYEITNELKKELISISKELSELKNKTSMDQSQLMKFRSQAVRSFDEKQLAYDHIKYLTTRIKFLEKYQRI